MSAIQKFSVRLAVIAGAASLLTVSVGSVVPAQADICPIPGICIPTGTPPTATTPVGISGTPEVGMVLTAVPPTWDQSGTTTTYKWQRAGTDIGGADAATYTVAADDIDQPITVVATGTSGLNTGTSTSDAVTGVIGDAPTPTAPMAVTGSPEVDETLTVVPGTWSGDPQPSFTYQWYRIGSKAAKIPGASGSSYVVTKDDVGRRLAAVVTAMRPGYTDGVAASQVVQVPKTTSKTVLALSKGKVAKNERARARIVLTAADHSDPTGKVVLRDGTTKLAGYTVASVDDGVLLLRLPKLSPGTHHLKATYAGNPATAGSASRVITLKVSSKPATD